MGGKKRTLRFRAANRDIFNAIRQGRKKVETRAATEKYRDIAVGDTAVFGCGRDRFEKQVKRVRRFRTLAAMLRVYTVREINPSIASVRELRSLYYSFPGYREKVKKYGFIALELH